MAKVKVTAIRFSEEELALLGLIQGHTGIRSRMEALRTVLQYYADAEGIETKAEKSDDGAKPDAAPEPAAEAKPSPKSET